MTIINSAHDALERLAVVPRRIMQHTEGWDTERLRIAIDGEWSAVQILAHIRAADDVLAYRAYAILARDQPTLVAYDERRWAEVASYASLDFRASLTLYTLRRAELVHMLLPISSEQWQRTGVHEVRGAVSLFDVVLGLLEHEEEHCAQLAALQNE
ncbi:MAG TPA: DinB family protein [Ktedonobacteraceae bacterium]|nr:DinB family protein [Ktedonobacteraceae bacterium]